MTCLDRDAWGLMHEAIWGSTRWQNGELLRISGATPGTNDFGARGAVPAGDAVTAWKIIERLASRGQNPYVSVGVQHASAINTRGRGKKVDVALLPALVVDLDVRSGVHAAGDRNPTMEEVDGWLSDYPLGLPTVTVHTGGGLHAWYVLDRPVDPVSELGEELRKRHKAWWKTRAAAADRNIDAGVLADITRVLRPAGSLNLKATPLPVAVRDLTKNRVNADDLLARLPAVEDKEKSARTPKHERERATIRLRDLSAGEKASDRFAMTVTVEDLVTAVFDAQQPVSANGISLPDADGNIACRDAGRFFYGESGEQRVTWFSTSTQAGFGLDSQEHSHSSFDVLVAGAGGGKPGFLRAVRLVEAWEGAWDTDNFITAAQAILSAECRSAFCVEVPDIVPQPPKKAACEQQQVEQPMAPAADTTQHGHTQTGRSPDLAQRRCEIMARLLAPDRFLALPEAPAFDSAITVAVRALETDPPEADQELAAPKPSDDAPADLTGVSLTIETGGGALRLRRPCGSWKKVAAVLQAWGVSARQEVASEILEFKVGSGRGPELALFLREAGAEVTESDRDSAAIGCEIRCHTYRAVQEVDGVWTCDLHRGKPPITWTEPEPDPVDSNAK